MPKQVYHIKAFEGGINKKADPRDIEDNQLVEATNVNVSNVGRVTMSGNGKSSFVTVNAENVPVSPTDSEGQDRFDNETPISSGHGLFSFTHDYDFNNTSVTDNTGPNEVNTEFICVNDGADIDIWTDNFEGTDYGPWKDSLISMGIVHNTGTDGNSENLLDVKGVKPIYYKAGNGLRVCDANFSEEVVERAMVSGVNLTVSGVSLTTEAGKFKASDVGTYIKIDSEVMKITAYSAGTGSGSNDVLTVERARFSTKSEAHHADSGNKNIIKINVPKVFTHIKRPMLKNAGANTDINRWVEDIQAPETPKSGSFKVFNFNPLGILGDALSEDSLYPSSPENVFLGLDFIESDANATFTLKDATAIQLESGNSTEQIIVLTVADESTGNAIDVTNLNYGFAIGKFLSISNAGTEAGNTDGSALNGVHEIVGFGSSDGEVKISSEFVTYTQEGSEEVVLEDQIIDDNLKNKYIFGMSYLYDGGGSEMQESNISTAHSAVGTPLINIAEESNFANIENWLTAPNDCSSETALAHGSENNNWKRANVSNAQCDSNGHDFLFYKSPSQTVSTNTDYNVHIKYRSTGTGQMKVYVGVGRDQAVPGSGMVDGTNFKTITLTNTGNSVINTASFTVKTHASSIDSDAIVAISANGLGSSELLKVKQVLVYSTATSEMTSSDAIDFRMTPNIVNSNISFLCNNSRRGTFNSTTQYNSWNERIEGFRIYMKQVDLIDEGLASEWLMLYDVNLKEGTYIMHAKDADVENLRKGDIDGDDWGETETTASRAVVTNNLSGDSIRNIPLITYEANNGYDADTTLAARYKATATVDRKVYIGNLKIGDKTFPDRMLRSDTDKFDTFPDDGTHFIDVATSDGESIVALESVGDKLIQYKEKTAYLIKVTSEGEELLNTWSGAGIKNSCQVAKSNEGIFWVNSNGIYYYDGEKLSNVSSDKFRIDNWLTNEDFKRPVIVGYDKYSNKLIILTTNISGASSSGYIYDIANSSITQHDNLFNWYQLSNPSDVIIGNTESEL